MSIFDSLFLEHLKGSKNIHITEHILFYFGSFLYTYNTHINNILYK